MTPAERKALGFLAALAAAGAGARAIGWGDPPSLPSLAAEDRRALQAQLDAVDSAHAHSGKGKKSRAGHRARHARTAAVPSAGDAPEAVAPAAPSGQPRAGPVDVDAADAAALEALPGIGPALARRIVADRAAHGPFGSMAGLSRVRGIGPALERRLAPKVTFSGVQRPSPGPAGWPPP